MRRRGGWSAGRPGRTACRRYGSVASWAAHYPLRPASGQSGSRAAASGRRHRFGSVRRRCGRGTLRAYRPVPAPRVRVASNFNLPVPHVPSFIPRLCSTAGPSRRSCFPDSSIVRPSTNLSKRERGGGPRVHGMHLNDVYGRQPARDGSSTPPGRRTGTRISSRADSRTMVHENCRWLPGRASRIGTESGGPLTWSAGCGWGANHPGPIDRQRSHEHAVRPRRPARTLPAVGHLACTIPTDRPVRPQATWTRNAVDAQDDRFPFRPGDAADGRRCVARESIDARHVPGTGLQGRSSRVRWANFKSGAAATPGSGRVGMNRAGQRG